MRLVHVSARSCTVLLDPDGLYEARREAILTLNGKEYGREKRAVTTLFGLWPDTEYVLSAKKEGEETRELRFRTEKEFCTLNVRTFGAKGDGRHDDTAAIQAALFCCPQNGRVLIPEGNYRTGPLFLKSHITVEIQKNAVLLLNTDRSMFPILPGTVRSTDENGEYLLGTWEGNPLDCFAASINGVDVEDVRLIGEGVIDGCAQSGDWWERPKERRGAYRGRLLYLVRCRHVTVAGLTFRNSPSWNLHPYFSRDLDFFNIFVQAPANSPNTDGFDPESCEKIRLYGARFSVGDDCIAIKAGKIYMGMKYHAPCRNIEIAWCAMLEGHGGVTVGSEMSGGVLDVRVHHCLMQGNDRGLRIKTRRGRGKYAVVDGIRFEHVAMRNVKTPLVINAMYFCDPDGKTPYVQSRERQPADDGTPTLGSIAFENVTATECSACVGYVLGLPEKPVGHLSVKNSAFSFTESAQGMIPAMAQGVETCTRRGLIVRNVEKLTVENVKMSGILGPEVEKD